jgi:hypothetical protein
MVGSLMTDVKEISKYKLNLVGVQEVRWDRGGTEPAGQYQFFYGKVNEDHEIDAVFFSYKRESYQQLRGYIFSDRMSYVILRGR